MTVNIGLGWTRLARMISIKVTKVTVAVKLVFTMVGIKKLTYVTPK
ncbi:MAG TPA: hypothetical protein VEW92_03365 [Nitrososphaeraceae archaeon]|nr:hypothetical protein [Nitrososphaeraceae archaeon]